MSRRPASFRWLYADRGATVLEYALVATFIAVVVSVAAAVLAPAVSALFDDATAAL